MPKEVHYLLFSPAETSAALLEYVNARPCPGDRSFRFAATSALLLQSGEDGVVEAQVKLKPRSPMHAEEVRKFAADDLLGALISFCRSRSIPVAQRGYKALEICSARLALRMTVDLDRSAPVVASGAVSYSDPDVAEMKQRLT